MLVAITSQSGASTSPACGKHPAEARQISGGCVALSLGSPLAVLVPGGSGERQLLAA